MKLIIITKEIGWYYINKYYFAISILLIISR